MDAITMTYLYRKVETERANGGAHLRALDDRSVRADIAAMASLTAAEA